MRKIYDKGGLDIQLGATYPLCDLGCRWTLNAYGAIEYLQKSGKSLGGEQSTSLYAVPFNLGLKPVFSIDDNTQYYVAIGPRFFYLRQHNRSQYVYENKSRSNVGLFVNTGFTYALSHYVWVDIFGEYSYAKLHFHSRRDTVYTRDIQVGGFTFGGGFGYAF